MAKSFGVWGIDIGQCALKAIRLELIGGQPVATAFDYIEHPKILSQPDADPDSLIRESLEKFLTRNPIGRDKIAVGIPGQSGLVRFVKLPPVEEKKVLDIVKFEAKQQIPFPLEEVVWDFQKIGGGETVGGFAMETEIGLFAMKREIIAKSLSHYQMLNAEVYFIQMAPLAICNFATYELLNRTGIEGVEAPPPEAGAEGVGEEEIPRGKKKCAVVLDIGTDSSNLVITDGGKIIWTRSITIGGNNFTRALTKEMKLTFAKAEHLKRNAAKSAELTEILRALRPSLTEFVGEVQRSLGFFTNTHRDAHISYMVGLGSAFRLPGLQKYLSEKLALDIRKPVKFDRLTGDQVLNDPVFTENLLSFPVAYGLAIQGLGLSRLQTNLLPGEIRTARLIKAKKPYVAVGAAALLIGTGLMALGAGAQLSSVTNPQIEAAMNQLNGKVTLTENMRGEIKKDADDQLKKQGEVEKIIIGNYERLNWIRFQEVLTYSLPRHPYKGAKYRNLDRPEQTPFWRISEADGSSDKAIKIEREKIEGGVPIEKMLEEDYSQFLANVNIEAVHTRYVESLPAFLTKAYETIRDDPQSGYDVTEYLDEKEKEADSSGGRGGRFRPKIDVKPGEEGGWVIELRGYTYHKDNVAFMKECLLGNLKHFDDFARETGVDKVHKVIPGLKEEFDPVLQHVSHVFLAYKASSDAGVGGFALIKDTKLDPIVKSLATPAAGSVPGGKASDTSWKPIKGGAPGQPAADIGAKADKKRFEFIVFMLWREPTPTDKVSAPAAP